MTVPSAASCTSISTQSAPSSMARRTAASVFSGASAAAPRCAITATGRSVVTRDISVPAASSAPPMARTDTSATARNGRAGAGPRARGASGSGAATVAVANSVLVSTANAPCAQAATVALASAQTASNSRLPAAVSRRFPPVSTGRTETARPRPKATAAASPARIAAQTRIMPMTRRRRPRISVVLSAKAARGVLRRNRTSGNAMVQPASRGSSTAASASRIAPISAAVSSASGGRHVR